MPDTMSGEGANMKVIKTFPRNFVILYDGTDPEMVARASALAVALLARGRSVELVEA